MFKRLPFGICSAQDIFQNIMSEIFEDIEGVEVVVDYILVWGASEEEHDTRLEKVLQHAQSRNLKLNKDKSQLKRKEISYIGHTLSEQGIKPDPKKVQAIRDMRSPTNKEELQRFLGMATYLSKFIPNYSEISAPLRVLLEKNTEWHWDTQQMQALNQLKDMATNHPTLKYFDPLKPTKISVDASSKGMGAVLLQPHSIRLQVSHTSTAELCTNRKRNACHRIRMPQISRLHYLTFPSRQTTNLSSLSYANPYMLHPPVSNE